jgi:hypothetical protein
MITEPSDAPSTEPDPIFAAIAAHQEAFLTKIKAIKVQMEMEATSGSREYQAALAAVTAAYEASNKAQVALTKIRPTTMAGVIALLAYIDDYHTGGFGHPEDPENYRCHHEDLGTEEILDDTVVDKTNKTPLELPYNFWLMRNVREALQNLPNQS